MRVCSLFSGIGGIDLGFIQAGFEIVWANEFDEDAARTYRYNFKACDLVVKNIKKVNIETIPDFDVLTAGFPCQPFSIAGKQHGFNDERGHLFYEVGKFISAYKPRFVFFENVPNLMEHDEGKTFLVIHDVLANLNYSIKYRVLRASEYGGVPQIRDRIYIIAFREQEDCDRFVFPDKVDLQLSIEDVLLRSQQKPEIYYYNQDDDFYKKVSKIVTRHVSIYRVYHDSIKVTQNHMCPTLTAAMGVSRNQVPVLVDDFGIRKLTLQECLNFQGFPKEYYFPKSITIDEAYKQVGNSVCVPVVKKIASKLRHVYRN